MAGGRPATGSAHWNPTTKVWEARITIRGIGRKPAPLRGVPPCLLVPAKPPSKCSCASCEQARRVAKMVSADARDQGAVPAGTPTTANEWHTSYLKVHGALGNHIEQHANDWRRYVADIIGTTPMTSITADHVKAIRDSLTKRRLDGKMSAKRCLNIWSDQIKAPFSRAWSDDDPKYGSVRVGPFASNPALGIKPPSSKADQEEDERERQALDPVEALALLSDEAVPLLERRLYAFAMFTGLRPSEMYGVLWSDVRLEEQVPIIKVQRGRHARTLEEKATKNRQSVRDLPIHPELRPMLRAMRDEAGDPTARVIPVANAWEIQHGAELLRARLLAAGVTRDELHHGTPHLKPFDVRSLRTTFATWCSKAGYDSTWTSRWLGHKPKGTAAKHYVKAVPSFEDVLLRPVQSGTVGPFPALPASLLGFGGVLVRVAKMNGKSPSKRRFAWVLNLDADLELALPHGYTPKRTVLEAMKPYVALLAKSLFGPEDRLVDGSFSALPASERAAYTGRAFCPTPRALAELRRAGVEPEPHPHVDVLRRVNSRAFSASLGQTLPGASFVTSLEAARAVLAERPPIGNGWRVKRNFGMTGRGQRVLTRAPDDADLAFLRAGLAEGGVQIEPNLSIEAEHGIHGMIGTGGEASLGVVVRQVCDARGAWLVTEPVTSPTQDDLAIAAAIHGEAERVAAALASAGYFGPFGVDSYVYRSENGNRDIQLRSEINARYSMGFAIGFDIRDRSSDRACAPAGSQG